MNYCFVDRANAHSIWSLIDSIAAELLTQGHSVTYCKFCEFDTITDRYTPPGVKVENIYVPSKNSILGLPKQILIFAYQFNKPGKMHEKPLYDGPRSALPKGPHVVI
ncbi:hypothetical protein [Cobetia crustatorum]|uniref:hypothetical protein n=1 Tax=Cobetia crustatorum TaxID=553385 RepID=UPI0012EC12AA|nr:hypothetical protein [Cobetia crustatorum]